MSFNRTRRASSAENRSIGNNSRRSSSPPPPLPAAAAAATGTISAPVLETEAVAAAAVDGSLSEPGTATGTGTTPIAPNSSADPGSTRPAAGLLIPIASRQTTADGSISSAGVVSEAGQSVSSVSVSIGTATAITTGANGGAADSLGDGIADALMEVPDLEALHHHGSGSNSPFHNADLGSTTTGSKASVFGVGISGSGVGGVVGGATAGKPSRTAGAVAASSVPALSADSELNLSLPSETSFVAGGLGTAGGTGGAAVAALLAGSGSIGPFHSPKSGMSSTNAPFAIGAGGGGYLSGTGAAYLTGVMSAASERGDRGDRESDALQEGNWGLHVLRDVLSQSTLANELRILYHNFIRYVREFATMIISCIVQYSTYSTMSCLLV